jgi:hypothetical protein
MAADVPPAPSPLTGQVLFYQNPEPLDSNRHAKLGMMSSDTPYGFARRQHFVPLQVGEFGPAAVNYPIIFAGDARAPLAVMAINSGENLFITEDGGFVPGAYMPAFIRRYPFVSARDDQSARMVVCIDREFELFTEDKPDVMLFENGEASAFTKRCVDFCSQFDNDARTTQSFVDLLVRFDLLESRKTTYTPRNADGSTGEPMVIAEFFAVSEDRLKALAPDKLAELTVNNAMSQIYAHMISLHGWDKLIGQTLARNAAAAAKQQPANA